MKLCFGKLCQLIQKYIKISFKVKFENNHCENLKNNQSDIVELLYGTVLDYETLTTYANRKDIASLLFRCKMNVNQTLQDKAKNSDHHKIINYVKENIIQNITDLEEFYKELDLLINNLPSSTVKDKLLDLIGTEDNEKLLAECLLYTFDVPNTFEEISTAKFSNHHESIELKKSFDIYGGDPHRRGFSTAISINLKSQIFKESLEYIDGVKEFHNFENCVDFIIKNNLKIISVNSQVGHIEIIAEKTDYFIKKIDRNNYIDSFRFIKTCNEEFRPKLSWRGRSLAKMAYDGLNREIWCAYGYFDNDQIIAYIDYKVRLDTNIEIGIVLTDPLYRHKGLASSLLWLFQLKFPLFQLYTGTFEENDYMRKAFIKTGFQENLFIDSKTGKQTSLIKERINPSYPNDPEKCTNSVYYTSNGIFKKIKRED